MIRLRKQKAANGRYANEDNSNPESPAPKMVLNDRSAGHRTYLRGQDDEQDEEDCESGSRFFEAEIPEVVEDADSNSEMGEMASVVVMWNCRWIPGIAPM